MRVSPCQLLNLFGGIKTQELVQPALDGIVGAIPDGLVHLNFLKLSASILLIALVEPILRLK